MGVDLIKNTKIIEKAYNDKNGYTAKFSLNLINIINKHFKSRLNINNFKYIGVYNKKIRSLQGFLVSKINQSFYIKNKKFILKKNEKIQVEVSNKFTIKSFSNLAKSSNWTTIKYWLDKQRYFALFLLKS